MALAAEVGELLEHFQWMSEQESFDITKQRRMIEDEVADVLIYLVRLADRLNIDPLTAASLKLASNAEKYPVALVRGSAKKYDEY